VLPRTSRTRTVADEVAEPSGGIVDGEKAQLRWSGAPGVHVSVVVTLWRPVEENVTEHAVYAPGLVNAKVARPEDAASTPPAATVAGPPPAPVQVFASRVAVMLLVALVTRLPFAS
jgi:hypothetical protein